MEKKLKENESTCYNFKIKGTGDKPLKKQIWRTHELILSPLEKKLSYVTKCMNNRVILHVKNC